MSNYQVKDNHIAAEYDVNGNVITQDEVNERVKSDIKWLKENGTALSSEQVTNLAKVPILESQLDDKANKTYVNSELSLKRNSAQKIELNDFSQSALNAINGGTTVEINSIPQDNSVNDKKILKTKCGKNLFNKYTAKIGYRLNESTGLEVEDPSYALTDFIEVEPNTIYTRTFNSRLAFYDANRVYISGLGNGTPLVITTPLNCYYIRTITALDTNPTVGANLSSYQIEKGNVKTTYEDYMYNIEQLKIEETNLSKGIVKKEHLTDKCIDINNVTFFERTDNLWDIDTVIKDTVISTSHGGNSPNVNCNASDFIEVKPNTKYTMNYQHTIYLYDENKTFLTWYNREGANTRTTLTTDKTKYVRFYVLKSKADVNTLMLSEGESIKEYVPYYQMPSIFVGNKNSKWYGKKIVGYGDSMTADQTWQNIVNGYFGSIKIARGIGGTTVRETGSIAYIDSDGNYISRPPAQKPVGSIEIKSSMVNDERINAMIPTDADCIIFFGGANDGNGNDPTFEQAYRLTLDKLYARCPKARIILLTVPYHDTVDRVSTDETYKNNYKSLRTVVEKIGNDYGYKVVKLKDCMGVNHLNHSEYMIDQIHWGVKGNERIAEMVIESLNNINP